MVSSTWLFPEVWGILRGSPRFPDSWPTLRLQLRQQGPWGGCSGAYGVSTSPRSSKCSLSGARGSAEGTSSVTGATNPTQTAFRLELRFARIQRRSEVEVRTKHATELRDLEGVEAREVRGEASGPSRVTLEKSKETVRESAYSLPLGNGVGELFSDRVLCSLCPLKRGAYT